MDPREILKLVQRHLLGLDAQLLFQLALRSSLHAQHGGVQLGAGLAGDAQGVRAAGIRPHVGEGDFLGGALLEQQAVVGVEQEDGEGAVQQAFVDVGHQVAWMTVC